MNVIPPQEWIAVVESIRFAGSISFVTFTSNGSSFQLVGDSRMLQPIHDHIGKTVLLHVKDFDDWTWQPLEEPNEEEESE